MRPNKEDYIAYYDYYINLIPQGDIVSALESNHQEILNFIRSIPTDKAEYKYADNKWTVKQVLNHIIDTERIFSYRALRFSRGDSQTLLPYDENIYAANASLSKTDLNLLAEEFDVVRRATILQYKQLTEKELLAKGSTSAGENNVLAIGFCICGHAKHHINIIRERYLNNYILSTNN